MRRAIAILAGTGLLVLAGAVALTAPDDAAQQAPFPVRAAIGQAAHGRTLETTVTSVRLARVASTGSWTGRTPGVWVVVQGRVESLFAPSALYAELRIGGVRYEPSQRPGDDAFGSATTLNAGLAQNGAFLFEVPKGAVTGAGARSAVIRISPAANPQLDSETETTVDLTRLTVHTTVGLDSPGLAER